MTNALRSISVEALLRAPKDPRANRDVRRRTANFSFLLISQLARCARHRIEGAPGFSSAPQSETPGRKNWPAPTSGY